MAHAHSLRVEVGEKELADQLEVAGWEQAALAPEEQALCAYADKLTRTPGAMVEADVERLRAAGWDDRAIHDACQVVAYFNYVNRLADGLGVAPEGELPRA